MGFFKKLFNDEPEKKMDEEEYYNVSEEEALEEARQQLNKAILYLYQIDQKTPEEIRRHRHLRLHRTHGRIVTGQFL